MEGEVERLVERIVAAYHEYVLPGVSRSAAQDLAKLCKAYRQNGGFW